MDLEIYIKNIEAPTWIKDILKNNLSSIPEFKDEIDSESNTIKRYVSFNWNNTKECIKLVVMIEEYDFAVLYSNFEDPILLLTYMSENVMYDPHCDCMGRKISDFEDYELQKITHYFTKMLKTIYNIDVQTYEDILTKKDLYHISNKSLFNLLKQHIEIDPFIIIKILSIQHNSEYLSFSSGKDYN
jgi:hypothetical protein